MVNTVPNFYIKDHILGNYRLSDFVFGEGMVVVVGLSGEQCKCPDLLLYTVNPTNR